jgi:PAS domain S-box-containing protein
VPTEALGATVLVVGDGDRLDAAASGLALVRAATAADAIARVERGDTIDAVVLAPQLADPVRVAQRLHSLDRDAAVVILASDRRDAEVRHALEVAPFLEGDVVCITDRDDVPATLADAVSRSRARRAAHERRSAPPLNAQYLGTLLDSAPIGVVTLDDSGAVIGWNRRAGSMLGVAEVEGLGRDFTGLWGGDDRERLNELIAGLDAGGLDSCGETFERGDHAFEITGARFTIRSGESGAILVLQDVTERVAAERALRLQKALLEAQADSAIAGIAVIALDGAVETVNRRLLEIWDIDEETARDRERMREIMPGQVADPDAFMAGVHQLVDDFGGEYRDEVRLKDGRTLERYGTHARDDTGTVVARVWFYTDITERKRDEERLRFLAEATEALASSLEWETTLRRVADLAVPRVADWCSVEVVTRGGRTQLAVAHTDPAKVEFERRLREQYPNHAEGQGVVLAIRTGESQLYEYVSDELLARSARDEEHLHLLRELGVYSLMIVPIQAHGRVFGALTFVSAESRHSYDEDDLRFAEEIGRRAGIAIDNAGLHAELRHTARILQESLLQPHLPEIAGMELAARFRPAGTGVEVGGDFYDLFETGEGQWAVTIGDVCGKGADAAALTALTRYTLRAAAMYEDSPGGVLRVLNEALLRQRRDFRFTTLAYCVLEVGRKPCSLRVASGGHPLPLVLRADGAVEAIGTGGPLVGVLPDAAFAAARTELDSGDVVVLYTDGLTDARAPGRALGEPDLMDELARCRGLAPSQIAECLERFALGDDDGTARDDIALIVASVL